MDTSSLSVPDNGLTINVAKTEHLPTRGNPLPMKLNGEELKNVDHLKYMGSVIELTVSHLNNELTCIAHEFGFAHQQLIL